MVTLTTFSFLFTLSYPLFICLNPGLTPQYLPSQIANPGGGLYLAEVFFLLLWSCPLIPSFLPPLPCWVLTSLLNFRTIWVYPSLAFQTLPPIYTGSAPTTPCKTLSIYWACPTTCSIDSPIICFYWDPSCTLTNTNKPFNWLNVKLHFILCENTVREWCHYCRCSETCYHLRYEPPIHTLYIYAAKCNSTHTISSGPTVGGGNSLLATQGYCCLQARESSIELARAICNRGDRSKFPSLVGRFGPPSRTDCEQNSPNRK